MYTGVFVSSHVYMCFLPDLYMRLLRTCIYARLDVFVCTFTYILFST